ncbi:MAG TPA: GAF domain-containing protein [Terriglobales bacterium]|nr:GAF domain-containing protein [Terriglobales bacterium]
MSESKQLQEIIESAVQQALEARLPELRAEIARQVAAALPEPEAAPAPAGGGNTSAQLNSASNSIQSATSQADILSALLEGAAVFAGRAALFVMRGGAANGWQSRGFSDNNVVKALAVDGNSGLAARAIRDRMPASAAAVEFSSDLVSRAGNPAGGNCVVLPLLVRDKVPALLYADAGTGGALDSSALEILVRTTGLWLEAIASRRAGPGAPAPEKIAEPAIAPVEKAVEQPVPTPPPVPQPPVKPAERVEESSAKLTAAAPQLAPEPAPAPAPAAKPAAAAAIAPGDEEVHKKAKRFAKLLVDEIRLYNQAKVAEGRQRRDLYDRLKDDIDKSRATYDKRYGSTPAAAGDYFNQELIRILADNDAALLGSNFPRS